MTQKDDNSGLLSKVVKFVRSPITNWSGLDAPDSVHESNYSKQMLKEMIERKRRNDFVRKREFDMLRNMRRSEMMAGNDPMARPSFFQSSLPSRPDDRASTLKKIDEIEAQMSMQWWKTKNGDSVSRAAASSSSAHFPMSSHVPPDVPGQPGAYIRTEPQPLLRARGGDPHAKTEPAALAPLPAAFPPAARADAPTLRQVVAPPPSPATAAEAVGGNSGFSASKQFAIDVGEFAHDPELEEAAIRFANEDDSGAEAGLLDVLGPQGSRVGHEETWLTLFDLYRATGQHDRFDEAAIEFAGRFARSAPQWMSLPELVGRIRRPAAAPAAGTALADWTSPSTVGKQTLATLQAALAKSQQPWRLSWTKLNTIDEAAVEGLTHLFTQWASQPVHLRFLSPDNLEKLLRNATVSGDKGVNPAWWKLRMEVMRVMHRPDEFEVVALDYCVTYEVSPPSWERARCEYKPLQADGSYIAGHTIVGDAFHDSMTGHSSGYTDGGGLPSRPAASVSMVELSGSIMGDPTDVLNTLENKLLGADVMVISCAHLIRIDFSAAGTLLNWVTARQAEGRQVQFIEVHRLVSAFFNVIGISEYARVVARRD